MHGQTISDFRQFSTPGIAGTTVTADASGIYVFESRPAPPGGHATGGIRKYDAQGSQLWTREFTVSQSYVSLSKAAADTTGVYVLIHLGSEPVVWLRKYSSGGDELWTRQLDFPFPRGVLAADSTGVYVAGGSTPSPSGSGAISYLRKYSADGAEQWTKTFDASLGGVADLAADITGVYLLNMHGSAGPPVRSAGVLVRKLDARGNELWAKEVNSSAVPRAFAAADPTGFYLVAVDAWGSGNFLRKYDSGGDELWSRKIDPLDFLTIATDATGVYLAGQVSVEYFPLRRFPALPGQCRSGSGRDSFVRKYDIEGAQVWTRQFGTPDSTWATGVALHPSGVYVVGQVANALRDEWENFEPFVGFEAAIPGAFLAKFEKPAAVAAVSAPRIFPGCVVNAASYVGGGVAPGEMVTIFGSAMGPAELVLLHLAENGRLANTLAETRVLFNGVAAPLVHVSEKQITAIVPYAVAGRPSVDVQVEYGGVRSEVVTMPVLPSRPGIFTLDSTGQGQGAILNEDGSVNSPSNPARRGSIISIFATGGGEAAPGVVDGQLVSDIRPRTSLPVSVFFDLGNNEHLVQQRQGEVLYAGGVPGSVAGLLQVNVRVPAEAVDIGPAVPFALFIGSQWTVFQVTVALR
ncbi:MAG: hypothetical protein ABI759_12220 [Candidatus Solibacter sp.]